MHASPWAVGAVLFQKQADDNYRPTAYGSRSLTDVEQKYGHIEKEALAILYGCEHFHMHLYGRRFELETAHRPLDHIYKAKPQRKPTPARFDVVIHVNLSGTALDQNQLSQPHFPNNHGQN